MHRPGVCKASQLAGLEHCADCRAWFSSIGTPIREVLNAPCSALMNERFKLAIFGLGNRVRVAGSAEIGDSPAYKRDALIKALRKVLEDRFPSPVQLTPPPVTWRYGTERVSCRPMAPP